MMHLTYSRFDVKWAARLTLLKVCFHIAQYPVRRTAQSALHFTPWQTCSLLHLTSLVGSIQPHCNSCTKTINSLNVPTSELVYDWATSHGRSPFCNLSVSPSSELCTTKCGSIGFMLFRYLSCLGAIISDVNTTWVVSVYACSRLCDTLVASCATAH